MRARLAVEGDAARWNGFVDREPSACLYHRWEWGDVFARVYARSPVRLLCEDDDGAVAGVLPLVSMWNPISGRALVSMPYFGHAGVASSSPDAARALVAEAATYAQRHLYASVELRQWHDVALPSVPSRDDKVLMILDLPSTEDALSKALGSKLRSQINRPRKEGMTTRVGGVELVSDFHAVYAENMRDLGSPCHARALFARALEAFHPHGFVVTVEHEGHTVAAGIVFGHRDTLEIPCASSLRSANKLSPNMLLYWEILRTAVNRGYRRFDFGRSSRDAGTYKFKAQWGAKEQPLRYLYLLRTGVEPPRISAANPRLAKIAERWSTLPLGVTNRLGPVLASLLP